MIFRSLGLFAATSVFGVALACGGGTCGHCAEVAKAAQSTDMQAVDGTALALTVGGVHCGGTAASAKAILLDIDGVKAANVDTAGKAELRFDPAKTDADKIIAAVAKSGNFTAAKREDA